MSDRPLPQFAAVLPALRRPAWHDLKRAAAHAIRIVVTRRDLRELEPRLLADIGVTRAEALAEAARRPWDFQPPRRWSPRWQQRLGVTDHIHRMWRTWQSRRRITELDARLLKDIGISYADAEREANKPFWR